MEEFKKYKIISIQHFLQHNTSHEFITELAEEEEELEKHASYILSNPHSRYKQIFPEFFNHRTRTSLLPHSNITTYRLMDIYHLKPLHDLIKKVTGWKNVYQLPLRTDKKFEINGKTNFYNSDDTAHLDWHFDKCFNYKGKQVICVVTLRNDWDTYDDKPDSLEFITETNERKSIYMGSGHVSIHDPEIIFHRVLPFYKKKDVNHSFRRTVHVMRFTNDPTPTSPIHRMIGACSYIIKSIQYFIKVGDMKWISITLSVLLCIILIVVFFIKK